MGRQFLPHATGCAVGGGGGGVSEHSTTSDMRSGVKVPNVDSAPLSGCVPYLEDHWVTSIRIRIPDL